MQNPLGLQHDSNEACFETKKFLSLISSLAHDKLEPGFRSLKDHSAEFYLFVFNLSLYINIINDSANNTNSIVIFWNKNSNNDVND